MPLRHAESLLKIRAKFAQLGSGSVRLHPLSSHALHPSQERHAAQARQPDSRVFGLCIDNPSRRNAVSPAMMTQLAEAVDALESPSSHLASVYGVVVYGANSTFCSGFDLSVAAAEFTTPASGLHMSMLMQDTLRRLRRLPVHVVAAVDGYALGGGAELALACDRRVMGDQAALQFVQARMGVSTGWGGTHWLVQTVGRSTALALLASCDRLSAHRCRDLGIATRAVGMLEEYGGTGDRLVATEVLRAAKRAVLATDGDESVLASGLENERQVFGSVWGGPANLAALQSVSSRKKP
ncbi:ClpP/crotonase-like domain-containing protein [Entophlyctis helioformis]|nr:ClpP/crotonase-like domain-containing protein [Entophlyctis helioformis]